MKNLSRTLVFLAAFVLSSQIATAGRYYDATTGRFLTRDKLAMKYPSVSPYVYTLNNPLKFIDPDGEDVVVALTGGAFGGGKAIDPNSAGTTGKILLAAQQYATESGIEFSGLVIESGLTSGSSVENALSFIQENYSEGERLIIYGYSYGGDFAVELASSLGKAGFNVNLLVTVDASDGPLQNSTVDRTISENVNLNQNIYQTTNSGASSGSQSTGSGSSNSGTSNSPGSNGGPNRAANPNKTRVVNRNVTAKGTTHGNIDEKYLNDVASYIIDAMRRENQ
jgi:hypothetical protein